jgi:hypothetical protein
MIWLHAHPLPPPFPSANLTGATQKTERQLADGKRRERGWAWSRIIRQQECLVLYKSFNYLCPENIRDSHDKKTHGSRISKIDHDFLHLYIGFNPPPPPTACIGKKKTLSATNKETKKRGKKVAITAVLADSGVIDGAILPMIVKYFLLFLVGNGSIIQLTKKERKDKEIWERRSGEIVW